MTASSATSTKDISRMTNPMIRKLVRVEQEEGASAGAQATYAGVCLKTVFFLLLTAVGVAAYFALHAYFARAGAVDLGEAGSFAVYGNELTLLLICAVAALLSTLLAWKLRPLVPVLGSVYALAQGYSIAMISASYAYLYQGIILLALVLTISIVFIMLILYTTRIVKVGHRFKSIVTTLFFTMLLGGAGTFLLDLLLPHSPIAQFLTTNPILGLIGGVLGIVVAALFLLSDFDTIETTVSQGLPKKYEWFAAFGLVITVLWLYLKILSLLARAKQGSSGN